MAGFIHASDLQVCFHLVNIFWRVSGESISHIKNSNWGFTFQCQARRKWVKTSISPNSDLKNKGTKQVKFPISGDSIPKAARLKEHDTSTGLPTQQADQSLNFSPSPSDGKLGPFV